MSLRDPAPDYLPRAQPIVHAVRSGARILGAGAVVAVLLAISGAFGSTALTIVPRTIYWLAMVMAGAVLGIAAAEFVIPMRWLLHRRILAGSAIGLIIALPMCLLVAVSNPIITHEPFRPNHGTAFQAQRNWQPRCAPWMAVRTTPLLCASAPPPSSRC